MTELEIVDELNVFPDTSSVDRWIEKYGGLNANLFPNVKAIIEKAKEYIAEVMEERIRVFLENHGVDNSIVDDYSYATSFQAQDSLVSMGTGALVGIGVASILELAFFPLAVVGTAVGDRKSVV